MLLLIFAALIVLSFFLIPAHTKPIKDLNGKHVPQSIASLEKIILGGSEQWILVRGEYIENPVLLFLHGGPGTSELGLLRTYNIPSLEKHYTVVTWDQRGAGKSFSAVKPSSSMTIEQLTADTHELTLLLCSRFNKQKIFLAGHSWGSALGILTVNKYPELYEAFIGIGQVVNMKEGERISYRWTLEQAVKANDKRAVEKLNAMGEPPYSGNWQSKTISQRAMLGKFGGEVYGNSKGGFAITIGALIKTPEYNWIDRINFFRGIFASMKLLWPQLMKLNLFEQVPELKVPVYFLEGRHDFEAPSILAEQYFNVLTAPKKELIWFENSAHFINAEEPAKFNQFIIDLKETPALRKVQI